MGIYDTYGDKFQQLKVGDVDMRHYKVGDRPEIPDGIYCTYEGAIVIVNGIFVADITTHDRIFDKWGNPMPFDLDANNPVVQAIKERP